MDVFIEIENISTQTTNYFKTSTRMSSEPKRSSSKEIGRLLTMT